jgi:hypothetical protein
MFGFPLTGVADAVRIEHVAFQQIGGTWTVSTTLRHQDSGWDHYADEWRVVDASGQILGRRVLAHPHEDEQPFTRSESGIRIPANLWDVFVEAHDKVHGWSADRVRVDLRQAGGARFEVHRAGGG